MDAEAADLVDMGSDRRAVKMVMQLPMHGGRMRSAASKHKTPKCKLWAPRDADEYASAVMSKLFAMETVLIERSLEERCRDIEVAQK